MYQIIILMFALVAQKPNKQKTKQNIKWVPKKQTKKIQNTTERIITWNEPQQIYIYETDLVIAYTDNWKITS